MFKWVEQKVVTVVLVSSATDTGPGVPTPSSPQGGTTATVEPNTPAPPTLSAIPDTGDQDTSVLSLTTSAPTKSEK